jgi:hypothetical protein
VFEIGSQSRLRMVRVQGCGMRANRVALDYRADDRQRPSFSSVRPDAANRGRGWKIGTLLELENPGV